jgi:hypothetical protein
MRARNRAVPILFCLLTATGLAAGPAEAAKRRAFVTSVAGNGKLASWPDSGGFAGVAAGDAVCRARAAAAGLPNAGAYRAWLSTASTDAYCHVQGRTGKKADGCSGSPQPAGPWFDVGGNGNLTGTLAELTSSDPRIFRPVLWNEFGNPLGEGDRYWTGTVSNGAASSENCSSWVVDASDRDGVAATPVATAIYWTSNAFQACNLQRRLLCLEPGASEPPAPVGWTPSILVFTTSARGPGDLGSWPEASGTGLAAGDAICRNLAAAAHLPAPHAFVAWLSDSTTDARDRLTIANVPYRRVDHYRIAAHRADLLDGTTGNSLNVDERGGYLGESVFELFDWTGTGADGLGTADTCDDWTAGSGPDEGQFGVLGMSQSARWTNTGASTCGSNNSLYCFSTVVTIFWDGFDRTQDLSRWSQAVP